MIGRKGYGRGNQGQWRTKEGAPQAPVDPSKVSRFVRLPSRIVNDGWWLVEDVVRPRRSRPVGPIAPAPMPEGQRPWPFQWRST